MFSFKRTILYSETIAERVGQVAVGEFIQRVEVSAGLGCEKLLGRSLVEDFSCLNKMDVENSPLTLFPVAYHTVI